MKGSQAPRVGAPAAREPAGGLEEGCEQEAKGKGMGGRTEWKSQRGKRGAAGCHPPATQGQRRLSPPLPGRGSEGLLPGGRGPQPPGGLGSRLDHQQLFVRLLSCCQDVQVMPGDTGGWVCSHT